MKTPLLLSLLALLPMSLVACSLECTAVGCSDSVSLDFVDSAAWPAGTYEFRFVADGKTDSCSLEVAGSPSGAGGGGGAGGSAGGGEGGAASEDTEPPHCTSRESHFFVTQLDGEFRADSLTAYRKVEVSVARDGDVFLRRTLQPTYETYYPNGEQCGPACEGAETQKVRDGLD